MPARVIAVAASKGGVGKTTMAYEIAATLGGVLVDLDWDGGGASTMWGYDVGRFQHAPLLDAFERGPDGPPPRPRHRPNQPDLVPGHPDLAASTIPEDLVADSLASWAQAWTQPYIVVDTHPGANALTDGAMQAADLVVVPVVLGGRELDALEKMLIDFANYHVLLAPNRVPPSPPKRHVDRLRSLCGSLPVAPPISEHRWLSRRVRRSAVTLQPHPGRSLVAAAEEFRALSRAAQEACGG